jgi:hypothetical protein
VIGICDRRSHAEAQISSLSLRERAGVRGADLMFKKVIIVHCDIDKPPFVILRLALRISCEKSVLCYRMLRC